MKDYRCFWQSRGTKYGTSWQYRRYIGTKHSSEPIIPIVNDPYSIYAYEHDSYRNKYDLGSMQKITKMNNGKDLDYYVLDERYSLGSVTFKPTALVVALSRFPQSFIYHLNGKINEKEYISVKNYTYEYLEPNAKVLPLVTVGAFACLSEYKAFKASDFEVYKNFLRTEDEVINCVGYCRLENSLYRINSLEYKASQNSYFNDVFDDPSVLKEGALKYRGYNYQDDFFKIPELKDNVANESEMLLSNNYPNRFSGYDTHVGAYSGSRMLSINIPRGGSTWSTKYSPDGYTFPVNVTFGDRSGCLPTNTFRSLTEIKDNPYLPEAGKQNPYEIQTIVFQTSAAGSNGRWFHIVTRYWWNPEVGG